MISISLCYVNNLIFFLSFFPTIIIIHSHDDESQVRWRRKKYSLSFPFHVFLFYAGWISFCIFAREKKRRMYKKSRELNVLFFKRAREISKRREEKLILPKSGLCSVFVFFLLLHTKKNFLLPLALLNFPSTISYVLSPPIPRTLHAALSLFVVWQFFSSLQQHDKYNLA